jgi:hypothetical protein
MNKIFNAAVVCAGLLLGAVSAKAQGSFDLYYSNIRTVQGNTPFLDTPATGGGTAGNLTNPPVDLRGAIGIATVDIPLLTNTTGGQVWTVLPQMSPDLTNWSTPLFALGTAYTAISTNLTYGTNTLATNNFILPVALTVPVPASAGFAYPPGYLGGNPYTNTAAVTMNMLGDTMLGIPVQQGGSGGTGPERYLREIILETATTATNAYIGSPIVKYYNNQ